MRLIDLDYIREQLKPVTEDTTCPLHIVAEIDQIVELAPIINPIDPIHAAGGCYCRECDYWNTDCSSDVGYARCMHSGGQKKFDDFCSRGRRREDA